VTDPDSEIMKTRRGWVQGYNGQAVVTADQIIVAAELTNQANDVQQLQPMVNQAQAIVAAVGGEDVALGTVLADAGYWSEANAATETADCRLLIATQKDHRQRAALREAPPPRGRIPKTLTVMCVKFIKLVMVADVVAPVGNAAALSTGVLMRRGAAPPS